ARSGNVWESTPDAHAEHASPDCQTARVHGMVEPERLQAARDPVTEMQPHDERRDNIKGDPPGLAEDLELSPRQVPNRICAGRLIPRTVLKLLDVDDHEKGNDQSRPDHRRGRKALPTRVARVLFCMVRERRI